MVTSAALNTTECRGYANKEKLLTNDHIWMARRYILLLALLCQTL